MAFGDRSIRQRLMAILLVTSGAALALTSAAFLVYELFTFRRTTLNNLSTLGRVIAANSTASLAFQSEEDATELLAALRAEPHITAAALYTREGRLFARYPRPGSDLELPPVPRAPERDGYRFERSGLSGWEPVAQPGSGRLGTLFLESDLRGVYGTLRLAAVTGVVVLAFSLAVAYLLSRLLQKTISQPILVLAETAKSISVRQDYSVRAPKLSEDELGQLTDAFNQMLSRIEDQDQALRGALQARDMFIGVASHELRTPLTSLQLHVGTLHRTLGELTNGQLKDKMFRHVAVLARQASRLTQLVESLLDVSRSMSGRFQLTLEDFDMGEVVRDLVARLHDEAAKAGSPLVVQIESDCRGRWDRLRVEQVLTNLLSNAMKFGLGKPIHIALQCLPDQVQISVRDEGVGIAPEDHVRVFERFEQARSHPPFGGLGLGLWIVRQIVTAMGGSVRLDSTFGGGAEFTVTLPKIVSEPARETDLEGALES